MSKTRKTILITCAGGSGPIYLAKKLSRRFNIVMADADRENVGSHLGFPFYQVPLGHDSAYGPALKRIIKRRNVNVVVPGTDEELIALLDLAKQMRSLIVVVPRRGFTELCINKKRLMKSLNDEGISHLVPFSTERLVRYPAVVKPIQGRGSREVHIIKNRSQLDGYLKLYKKKFSEVLVQSYAGGAEYTVSVIVNNLNKIIGIVPKRIIKKRGITRAAVTEKNARIEKICRRIVDCFTPAGPFNVQLKIDSGKLFVFEINPRLSTTTVLTDHAFGNEVELFIDNYDKVALPRFPVMKAPRYLYRYEENVLT